MNSSEKIQSVIQRCEELYEDLQFSYIEHWKKEGESRKAVGFMPIYVPRELIHAAGILPVGLMGAGDQLEIIRGDSYFQSYICHIPRSIVELGLLKQLENLDGFLFPSTCDVIRNLSGMWKVLFPHKYVKYFDVPQNFNLDTGGSFYRKELEGLKSDFEDMTGKKITSKALNESIALYNENRELLRNLYRLRQAQPWVVPTLESYLLLRAGMILDVKEHNEMLCNYLSHVRELDRRQLDNCRVVLQGVFCEQPPLGLIKTLERAGCYIVADDFVLVSRWHLKSIPEGADPLENLCRSYFDRTVETAAKYDVANTKGRDLVEEVQRSRADGVIFCAPSFCDPALLDQPMQVSALEKEGIPYTQFKYSENTGQFQVIREQAGTFSDSVKLWGTT